MCLRFELKALILTPPQPLPAAQGGAFLACPAPFTFKVS